MCDNCGLSDRSQALDVDVISARLSEIYVAMDTWEIITENGLHNI